MNTTSTTWRTEKLESLLSLIIDHRGITPKKLGGAWVTHGVPALSALNIKAGQIVKENDIRFVDQALYEKWMPEKLDAGDILLTSEAPLGEVYFLREKTDYCLSQRLFALRADPKKLDPKYLYYFLRSGSGQHQLERRVSGTAAQGIRQAELRQIEVSFPENVAVQTSIGDTLAAFDEKIEVNNRVSRTLEQMAQAIFKEWFVDFRFPGHENAEFVDSELGRIPEGWEVKKFGDACGVFGGGTPSTQNADYWGGKIHWATPTDMTALDSEFIDDTERKITEAGLKESAANLLPENSILMTSRATVGLLAINKIPITTNQGFIALVCGPYPSCTYVFGALQRLIPEVQSRATGSTFPEISRGVFKEMALVIPPVKTNEDYDRIVSPIYDQMYLLSREKKRLVVLRDSLLPKLMSGEIRV